MDFFLRLSRFLAILSGPLRNPYALVVLLLAMCGIFTVLRGPQSLVWGGILLWMALMLRLQYSQRELLKTQVKLLETDRASKVGQHGRTPKQEREG